MTIEDDLKLANEKAKYRKYCEFCHHTMTFYAFEPDKKLCNWCGRYNYRNDLIKFKSLLSKKKKEV